MSVSNWRRLKQESGEDLIIFQSRYDHVENPRTGRVMKRLVLESVDWVNVVATTTAGELVMVRQHRFGTAAITLETPGGMVDPGETHEDAARRELLEETGYSGGQWRYLGAVEPNPAFQDNLCHHWFADGVAPTHALSLGAGEDIEVLAMPLPDVQAAIDRGELRHALALSALARSFDIFGGQRPGDIS